MGSINFFQISRNINNSQFSMHLAINTTIHVMLVNLTEWPVYNGHFQFPGASTDFIADGWKSNVLVVRINFTITLTYKMEHKRRRAIYLIYISWFGFNYRKITKFSVTTDKKRFDSFWLEFVEQGYLNWNPFRDSYGYYFLRNTDTLLEEHVIGGTIVGASYSQRNHCLIRRREGPI